MGAYYLRAVSGGREQTKQAEDLNRERMGSAPGRIYVPMVQESHVVRWGFVVALLVAVGLYLAIN